MRDRERLMRGCSEEIGIRMRGLEERGKKEKRRGSRWEVEMWIKGG